MVKVDEAFELRYKKEGEQFEVLIDFDKYQEFIKNSKELDIYDVLADTKVFKDQKKGLVASENLLFDVFKTQEIDEVLREILFKGEAQIPTAYLNKMRGEKKTQIISYIVENALNSQTKAKYTFSMIEREFDKIRFSIDPFRSFEPQAEEVLKLLKREMPISIEKVVLAIEIPGSHCGNFYGQFRKKGKLVKEAFTSEGNLQMLFEITESKLDDIANYIKQNSNGEGSYFVSSK